jgi:catechol 2,3-dioxygenase-like lactoylglutathione lyase family enzyme
VIDRLTIRVSDREASERFYATVLRTLGIVQTSTYAEYAQWDEFALAQADDEHPVTRGVHVGFRAPSREHVDAFWRVGTGAGYRNDGEPGPRSQYSESYYGSFLLDPDGNSAEGVHHGNMRDLAAIDHVWMRVADVGAAKRFYESIAGPAGIQLNLDKPDWVRFAASNGTFSLVSGGHVTENVHLAFRTTGEDAARVLRDPDGNVVELVCYERG